MSKSVNKARKLDRFKRQAEQFVASNVTLVDEMQSDDQILAALKESPAGKARAEAGKKQHILIFYDQQDAGEAQAQPHLRTPPLRSKGDHLKRFLRLMMQRRDSPDDLDDGDVYVLNDAGRAGNKSVLLNAFTNSAGQVQSQRHILPWVMAFARSNAQCVWT